MICFPLDNTEYDASALGSWCCTRTRGVYASDSHYSVTANGGMSVTVSPGLAWLRMSDYWGVNAFESNPTTLTLDLSDGSLSRIDAVCVRLDKVQNKAEVVIKKGSYDTQPPVVADPVRDLNYDEIYVATIAVAAGATAISEADITDQRLNEDYCGVMRDGVTAIPTEELYSKWQTWMSEVQSDTDAFFADYQSKVKELYALLEADATADYDVYKTNLNAFESSSQALFTAWFNEMKGQLSEDAAGNLQNEIDEADADNILRSGFVNGTVAKTKIDGKKAYLETATDGRYIQTIWQAAKTIERTLYSSQGVAIKKITYTKQAGGDWVLSN